MLASRGRLFSIFRITLGLAAMAWGMAAPSAALTPTPTPMPTATATCAPTGTPYCAAQCEPCPTIRAGCFAEACGACRENPVCAPGETCEPLSGGQGFGGCCLCATATTPAPSITATPSPTEPGFSPTPTATASPTPQRTGDLGTAQVSGHVYDAQRNGDEGIASATVSYWAPGGSGAVQTDAAGAFSFSLFLHDTDLVTIGAAAAGFHASELRYTGVELWFQTTPLAIRLIPIEPGTHRVSGLVHRDPLCSADSLITIELADAVRGGPPTATTASQSGAFAFEGVRDGDYVVSAVADCHPSQYASVTVHVRGADVYTELVSDMCPTELVLDPTHGLPGTAVDVVGRCYYIHSGGLARVYLDALLLTEVHAETGGDYRAQIRIPDDAEPGWHSVNVQNVSGTLIGSTDFWVNFESTAPCLGDCDRNGEVTVSELLTMVGIALGDTPVLSSCPAAVADGGNGPVRISGIIAAVNVALNGCAGPQSGTCYESAACAPYEFGPYEPFASDRGNCCRLQRTEGGVPFSWCPAEAFDPSSGACTQCANPC